MLEHLSSKFRTPPQASFLEPRAALILNRFSHSLTVLYATDAVAEILGVTPEELDGKSFYDCMQENCYPDAERCLRSAKENDSIAYLRFWYHDPRNEGADEDIRDASVSSDSEDGGVRLNGDADVDMVGNVNIKREDDDSGQDLYNISSQDTTDYSGSRGSSDRGSRRENNERSILDVPGPSRSYALPAAAPRRQSRERPEPREIEAVVSCTSDGLVVVLRRARPRIPLPALAPVPLPENGVFAAPWGAYVTPIPQNNQKNIRLIDTATDLQSVHTYINQILNSSFNMDFKLRLYLLEDLRPMSYWHRYKKLLSLPGHLLGLMETLQVTAMGFHEEMLNRQTFRCGILTPCLYLHTLVLRIKLL